MASLEIKKENKKYRKWFWIALFFLMLFWPPVYFILPLEASVVDKVTRKPIADAIVVWHWELHTTNLFSSHVPYKTLIVGEDKTDPQGRFRLTSWPKLHFPPLITWLSSNQPYIKVFKPGYEPKSVGEGYNASNALSLFRRSKWHEQKIELFKRERN